MSGYVKLDHVMSGYVVLFHAKPVYDRLGQEWFVLASLGQVSTS